MTPIEQDPTLGLNGAVSGELRAMKARRRMSNEQVAERSGIPLVSVNRYMSGKRPINLATLAELCRAMHADPADIVASALSDLTRSPRIVTGEVEKVYERRPVESD